MTKARRREWVLYCAKNEYFIARNRRTPLNKLNKLMHYTGSFFTYEDAEKSATRRLMFLIKKYKKNIRDLKKNREIK